MSSDGYSLSRKCLELVAATENPLAETMAGLKDVLPLSQGDPDLSTPSHIVEAAKSALDGGYTHYTPVRGLLELRKSISKKLARENGFNVDPAEEIIVTSGGQEGIFALMQVLLEPGDEILLPDPCYTAYTLAVTVSGAKAVPVPTFEADDFLMRPRAISERITPRTKALLVVNPNMPAGGVFSRETLEDIAELVQQRGLLVICDEMYEKFTFDGARHVSMASLPDMRHCTITLGGLSKTYSMTGWRVGYVAGPGAIVQGLEALKNAMSICAASVSQAAAIAALEGSQVCVEEARQTYDERRRFLMERLDRMSISYGRWQGGFSVLANIKSAGLSALEFSTTLLRNGRVYASPGTAFGPAGEGYVRISFLSAMPQLEEAITRFERVWENAT